MKPGFHKFPLQLITAFLISYYTAMTAKGCETLIVKGTIYDLI